MIPMTRELRAALMAAVALGALASAGALRFAAAQSAASENNPAATKNAPNPPNDGKSSEKKSEQPAPQTEKPKVITNDDINADRARGKDGSAPGAAKDTHAIAGTGECDDLCAEQARELAGFGPDRDGEWQFALTAARRSLAADPAWSGAYVALARGVNQYCTFQQQLQMTAVPSGNDYNSRVERAKTQKYAEDMNRVLEQNVVNANAEIERMAQQAEQTSEPARGAIMRVLAQRVNDSCDP
jgi:hypothetical protein